MATKRRLYDGDDIEAKTNSEGGRKTFLNPLNLQTEGWKFKFSFGFVSVVLLLNYCHSRCEGSLTILIKSAGQLPPPTLCYSGIRGR